MKGITVTTTRSAERIEFLSDVLCTAVEHAGYGFFDAEEYRWENVPDGAAYARIVERQGYETGENDTAREYTLDVDTIARGIGVIRRAVVKDTEPNRYGTTERAHHNAATGQRLFMSGELRHEILQASDENDAGEIDVIGALAIVECALFGAVTYG